MARLATALLYGLLALELVGARVEAAGTSLDVTTEPPHATVLLDGIPLGLSPYAGSITVAPGSRLSIELKGYETVERRLPAADAPIRISLQLAPAGATITVSTLADPPLAPDGTMSLRKALAIARGDLSVTGAESLYVRGPAGPDAPTLIRFSPELASSGGILVLNGPLPPLDHRGHALEGPGRQLVLMPAPGTASHPGLMLGPGTRVAHLALDGFLSGVAGTGTGTNIVVDDLAVTGAEVGLACSKGATVQAVNTVLEARFAPWLGADGCSVTGATASEQKPAEPTAIASAAGGVPLLVFAGAFDHEGGPPALYVRKPARIPISEVPDVAGTSSSYAAYRVFSAEGMQEWAINAIKGKGDFRWELGNLPLEREFMAVNFARPVRLSGLSIRRIIEPTNKLLAYRVVLFDAFQRQLADYEVSTPPSDKKPDALKVEPALDVSMIEIRPLKVEGTGPAISSIEADVLDGPEYAPLAWSSDRIVFPLPPPGTAPVVRVGRGLYALPDASISSPQIIRTAAPTVAARSIVSGTRITVTNPGDRAANDGRLTLREAIRIANHERPPSASEKPFIEGAGDPIVILLRVPEVMLSAPLPVIATGNVAIRGDGTQLRGAHPGTAVIEASGAESLELDRLTLNGGVVAHKTTSVTLRGVTIASAGVVGIDVDAEVLMVSASKISGGQTGIVTTGEAQVVNSRFAQLGTGIKIGLEKAHAILGNDFEAVETPISGVLADEQPRPWLVVAGNTAPAAARSRVVNPAGEPITEVPARSLLEVANHPPLLGLPPRLAGLAAAADQGTALVDLRQTDAAPAMHFIDYDDPSGRLLVAISGEPPVRIDRSFAALLFDRPVIVWYSGSRGSDRRILVPPGAPAQGDDLVSGDVNAASRVIQILVGATTVAMTSGANQGGASAGTAAATTKDLGSGAALPTPYPPERVQQTIEKVSALISRNQQETALVTALMAASRWPSAPEAVDAVVYAADRWADTVSADRADALMAALERRFPGDARVARLEIGVLNRQGLALAAKHEWAAALGRFERLVLKAPADEAGPQNIAYVYQEWGRERLQSESLDAVLIWLDQEKKTHPKGVAALAGLSDRFVEEAAHRAYDAGDATQALDLYARLYDANPSDDRRRQNLLAAIQRACRVALSAGGISGALPVARTERDRFGKVPEIDRVIVSVFAEAIDAGVKGGRGQAALSDAITIAKGMPGDETRNLLAFAAQAELGRVAQADGFAKALGQWTDLHKQFPDAAPLTSAAVAAINNEAIRLADAGQHEAAIDLYHRGLALTADSQLRSNLRITYINWAVGLVNGGKAKEALPILERAKAEFAGDADIEKVFEAARQRAH